MSVRLDKPLKRELAVGDGIYTLTISAEGLKLAPKGRRNGVELQWRDLVTGQAALAVALNASLERVATFERGSSAPASAAAPAPARRSRTPKERGRARR